MLSPLSRSKSGFTVVVLLVVLVGGMLAIPVYHIVKDGVHLFGGSDSKVKTQVVQLTADAGKSTAADNKVIADQAGQITNLNQQSAQVKARDQIVHQDVIGSKDALLKESPPSLAATTALTFLNQADQALDPLDQIKIDSMQRLVDQLMAKDAADQAAGAAQVASMQSQLDGIRDTNRDLTVQNAQLTAQTKADQVTAKGLQTQVATDEKGLAKWAADNVGLLATIKSLTIWIGVLVGVVLLLHWLLPLLGIVFPGIAPLVKGLSAIIALPLHILHSGEKAVLSAAHVVTQAKLTETQTALTAEKAAHAATTANLTTVATIAATSPTVPIPSTT